MLFKEYLQNLSKIQVFQLYTIIAICILLPYFKYIETPSQNQQSNQNLSSIKSNIIEINQKLKKPDFVDVLKEFEIESEKYKSMEIKNFAFDKNSITIKGVSSEKDFLKYILYCENYSFNSILNSLSIKPINKSKLISFSFNIKFKKSYSKKLLEKTLLKEYSKINSHYINLEEKPFKLQGILNNFAIIDNKILSVGDIYNHYKIQKINNDNIIISNKKTTKTLYLTKRINNDK